MPSITIREYHPESGALLGNVSTLSFGRISAGTHSRVKVIDVAFEGVSNVGSVKIGLVSSGNITVSNHFGVESSSDFSASKAGFSLDTHFSGLNGTGSSSDSNNVAVGLRSSTVSDYIYLDFELGASNIGAGNGAYKIFFDYS